MNKQQPIGLGKNDVLVTSLSGHEFCIRHEYGYCRVYVWTRVGYVRVVKCLLHQVEYWISKYNQD